MILLIAIGLFVLEFFLPSGGMLGVLSGLAFLSAIGSAFYYGGMRTGTIFLGSTAVLIPVLLVLVLKWWPKTPIGKRILMEPPDEDEVLPTRRLDPRQWVGQHGIAMTPMLPSGAIRVGDRTIDAISDGMSIEKQTPIVVVAVRGNYLVVRPTSMERTMDEIAEEPSESAQGSGTSRLDTVIPDPFEDPLA
jgi:membrane-bound serine protease (ClpP class)